MSYLKSIREAFAHKSFFWLFFATSISLIGTQSLNYGFQAHLFALTKDNALLGFNNFMFYGAMLISLIFGGVVGDSYPKKKLLLLAESLSIPLCLFLLTDLSPKTLIFLKALLAFVSSFLIPLRLSYIKTIFKNKNIKTMVSLFSITQYSAMLLGPAIGTYLYEFFQSWKLIVLLDSGSFVLGSIFIALIRKDTFLQKVKKQNYIKKFYEGIRHTVKTPKIRLVMLQNLYHDFFNGYFIPLLLPFIMNYLNFKESHLGNVLMAYGTGSILGGLWVVKITQKHFLFKNLRKFRILEAIVGISWILATEERSSIVLMFFWGICASTVYTLKSNIFVAHTPDDKINRVLSLHESSRYFASIAGSGFLVIIGKHFSAFQIIFYSMIATLIIELLICVITKESQYIREENKADTSDSL